MQILSLQRDTHYAARDLMICNKLLHSKEDDEESSDDNEDSDDMLLGHSITKQLPYSKLTSDQKSKYNMIKQNCLDMGYT